MRNTIIVCICILALLCFPCPILAQADLLYLTINEEFVPGPDDIYLTVTGTYADGSKKDITEGLAWVSSNQSIATVSYSGRLHFTGQGGYLTIAVYKGSISGRKSMYVQPWPEKIEIETKLVKSDNPYRLVLRADLSDGSTRYLGPEDNVRWSTSNPWVAWVNSQGVVTFTGESGYVSVKAELGELSHSVGTTVTGGSDGSEAFSTGIKIKDEIKYSPQPLQVKLAAIMSDGSETEIPNSGADWSSSNPEVATVTSEGEIIFTGRPGFTRIKVTYGGYSYEKLVTVDRFLESISINESLNYTSNWDGKPLPLSATVRYNDGSEFIQSTGFTWSVDNKKVAGITENGVLTFTGMGGAVTVNVKGQAYGDAYREDSIKVEVPVTDKPVPQRLSINNNPVTDGFNLVAKVFCLYSDGSVRDVSDRAVWLSATPDTVSVFKGQIYLTPNPGPIRIRAQFLGLTDEIRGYNNKLPGRTGQVYQLRIKQHSQPYSHTPVNLTALAVMGDGSIADVTGKVWWHSSQPLIARIDKGKLTFTGRPGKAVITAQGYGFRDELNLEVLPAELQSQVVRLEIEGELVKGGNQLKAVAYFNDGTSKDVTKEAVWNTSNRNTALVIEGSVIFPAGLKPVIITADYGGKEVSLNYQ